MKNRFEFGDNWRNFLKTMDAERLEEGKRSLVEWFGTDDLGGKRFLDIGSGSGLFSLSARALGAKVESFDYDPNCVWCTKKLKEMYFPGDDQWNVERGDVLDKDYLSKYKDSDIVYSWGVLHHTGNMYRAIENAGDLVRDNGMFFIAIYNDQGGLSVFWKKVKKIYNNNLAGPLKLLFTVPFFVVLWTVRIIEDFIRLKPFDQLRNYKKKRGMSPWHDAVDWVGGYPFEVAKPEEIIDFCKKHGFVLEKMKTYRGTNKCNEYLFVKKDIR